MEIIRENSGESIVARAWLDKQKSFYPHWHTQLEMVYVISGELQAKINGIAYSLEAGDVLLCASNDIHSYSNTTGGFLILMVSPTLINENSKILQENCLSNHCVRGCDLDPISKTIIETIINKFAKNRAIEDGTDPLIFTGFCLSLIGFVLNKLDYTTETNKIRSDLYDYMRRAFEFIGKHYCEEKLNLEMVAKNIGISPCYLSRCFKTYSGYSFTEYVNRKRVKKAEKLLKETNKKVLEISMECGYGSLRNFNRAYKGITGNIPKDVRSDRYTWYIDNKE